MPLRRLFLSVLAANFPHLLFVALLSGNKATFAGMMGFRAPLVQEAFARQGMIRGALRGPQIGCSLASGAIHPSLLLILCVSGALSGHKNTLRLRPLT